MKNFEINNKYGNWTVLDRPVIQENSCTKVYCSCICKKVVLVNLNNLKRGKTTSCGCLKAEKARKQNTTHGGRYTALYRNFSGMHSRCNNPNYISYHRYGGRGITVCQEWKDFTFFQLWALTNGYEEGLSIDRIDNDRGYSPDNCRWITADDNNKARARKIKRNDGKIFNNVHDMAKFYGIKAISIYGIIQNKTPINFYHHKFI